MIWSVKELEILKKLYPTDTLFEVIMKSLSGRSHNAVRLKASRLGLKRPIHQIELKTLLVDLGLFSFNLDGRGSNEH